MSEVKILESRIASAAQESMDAFVDLFADSVLQSIGGSLTAESMQHLNADQCTLLAWHILHEEVMDGGFVQLLYNGYGPFFFQNPFRQMMRQWGLDPVATLINRAQSLYRRHKELLTTPCSDDEFMALFEKMTEFDDLDDTFVEHEEEWTARVAYYIDEHIADFATVVQAD